MVNKDYIHRFLRVLNDNNSKDYVFIELLRYKSLIAKVLFAQEITVTAKFVDFGEESYLTIKSFTNFLKKAIST